MPARPRRDPTDEWAHLHLLVTSPAQETDEILRPAVARVATAGMRRRFDPEPSPPSADRRRLPGLEAPEFLRID